jgi:hypothetical protein
MSKFRRYEYLLSALPGLEPIGSVPPIGKRSFLEMVIEAAGPVRTIETILLNDDIQQYQGLLAGEIDHSKLDMAILTVDKDAAESVLPEFLLPADDSQHSENDRLAVDEVWSRYFRHAEKVAEREQSDFLRGWICFEAGLRNALVTARAQALDLDAAAYLVVPELADSDMDYSAIISAWSSAANPLAAQETLDKARWDWLSENEGWFSFKAAEIEVYAAKLVLLHHWRRILSGKKDQLDLVQT